MKEIKDANNDDLIRDSKHLQEVAKRLKAECERLQKQFRIVKAQAESLKKLMAKNRKKKR